MALETTEKYCPICGKEVKDLSIKRFGEYLCSEEHAEEYVKEVRAQKQRATTAAAKSLSHNCRGAALPAPESGGRRGPPLHPIRVLG